MPPARALARERVEDESEVASAAFCRICFEPGDELISPCMCTGTQRFVHRSCLDHWRSVKEGTAFSQCTTCKAQFHLRVQFLEGDRCRKMKFRLRVATDILLVFLAIQTAIAAIGGVAYLLDKDGKLRNNFMNDWVPILSKRPVPFYYCTGVVVFFALVGFLGFILHCSTSQPSNNRRTDSARSSNDVPDSSTSQSSNNHGTHSARSSKDSRDDGSVLVVLVVIIFAILGIVYAFVAATIVVQKILQRHYHILVKKELTKEYVVEDLEMGYAPPKMDPEHEQHLKMLRLM